MKKLLIGSSILITVVLSGILIAVNTPLVVKEAAKRFAPEYKITYQDISGNVLEGITIDAPQYDGMPLAKQITLRWNPIVLLQKKISLTKVTLEEGNVSTVKALIDSFGNGQESDSTPFSFEIAMESVDISLLPFEVNDINVSGFTLKASLLSYAEENLAVDAIDLVVDSNVTDIKLLGSYEDEEVDIRSLSVKRVDIPTLYKLITQFEGSDEGSPSHTEENPKVSLMPTTITVDHIYLNAEPAIFDPLEIHKFDLEGQNIKLNLENGLFEEGSILLDARSNLSKVVYKGVIKENSLKGKVALTPNNRLFELSGLPLRKEAFGDIVVDIVATGDTIKAEAKASAKHILTGREGEFNIDIKSLSSSMVYRIDNNKLDSESKVIISTPYAENILLTNQLELNEKPGYHGEIRIAEFKGFDQNLTHFLQNLSIKYRGDEKVLNADLISKSFIGDFLMEGYQKGSLKLKTKKRVKLEYMAKLSKELEGAEVALDVHIPFDLEQNDRIDATAKITSNVVNMDTNVTFDKIIKIKSRAVLPKDSLARSIDPNLQWDALNPMDIEVEEHNSTFHVDMKSGEIKLKADYSTEEQSLLGKMNFGSLEAQFEGNVTKELKVNAKIGSIGSLTESIQTYYALGELPVVEGSTKIKAVVNKEKKIDISFESPRIIYKVDRTTDHRFSPVSFDLTLEDNRVLLQRYDITYNQQRVFATKPSLIEMKDGEIYISPLWLNDGLQTTGQYNLKTRTGEIEAKADSLKIEHEWADIVSRVDIDTILDGNYTDVKGDIVLLGGNIHYDMRQRNFVTDSDIVIVQDIKEAEPNGFMNNLSVAVNIETQKPLHFKQDGINIKSKIGASLYKASKDPMMLLGTLELLEGGTYLFQNKKFVLEKSFIYFTGTIDKPLLEIKAKYKSLKHLIYVSITGTPEAPIINFSSSPSLTREQILSVLLFDSEAGGDTYSGEEMMKMMGGAMAKSALANVGVQIDHLVLGEGNSIEVGKKLTRDITIIYINDEIPKVELKYRHTDSLESVIGASEESTSYDIIYIKDLKSLKEMSDLIVF